MISPYAAGWIAVAVAAAFAAARYLLPRFRTVVDGNQPGPPPYTATTEQDTSWLSELPAIPPQEDQ